MEEKRENLFDSNQKTHCLPTLLDGELGWKKERNDIKSEREEREREGLVWGYIFFFFMNGKTTRLKYYTHVLIFLGIKHKYVFSLYILKMKKPKH